MGDGNNGDFDLSELGSILRTGCTVTTSQTGICLCQLPDPPKNALRAERGKGVVEANSSAVEEKHPDVSETLAPNLWRRIELLRALQRTYNEIKANYFKEKEALAAKYQKLYDPLYEKRYKVVNGLVEVNDEQKEGALTKDASEDKGVPEFWLTAMKANEILNQEIQEHDEGALKFLKDIKWCRINFPNGFKLEFVFDRNPYFKNPVLTKTYYMNDDGDEQVLEQAIGTRIKWFPRKCLTMKAVKRKSWRSIKNTNPSKKFEKRESFFNFFSPPLLPTKVDDLDDETADHLQNLMEHDYEVGARIRDQIIPKAVLWFTGEAVQEDDCEDENDDDYEVEVQGELEGEKS